VRQYLGFARVENDGNSVTYFVSSVCDEALHLLQQVVPPGLFAVIFRIHGAGLVHYDDEVVKDDMRSCFIKDTLIEFNENVERIVHKPRFHKILHLDSPFVL
jgi:hypothetical protein